MAYKASLIFCILLLSFPAKVGGGYICYASCLAAVGGGGLIAGAAILPILGFTAGGITAGSWAAAWMASYAGAVPAAGLLAFLQSIGAAGVSWTSYGSVFGVCSALCAASDYIKPSDEDNNTQTELTILNGDTNLLNQTNSTKVATRDSQTIRHPREESVASATYQELKTSFLEMQMSKIVEEKRKLKAETEKINLENTMLELQIKKMERDLGDNDK